MNVNAMKPINYQSLNLKIIDERKFFLLTASAGEKKLSDETRSYSISHSKFLSHILML